MELTFTTFLIVCPLIFLGSFMDAIAGGGALITLPAYIMAGVPIHMAIGTNKISSVFGVMISSWRLCKNKFVEWRLAIPTIPASLIGSAIGAHLALLVGENIMKMLLLIILPFTAFYVFRNKNMESEKTQPISTARKYLIVTAAAFLIGGYDGFYGPGTGTFLLLTYTGLAKMDVRTASGNVKLVNMASNISAAVTFVMNGKVLLPLGLTAALFSIAGQYIGSGMVMKNGSKIVRPVILVVLAILFVKIIYEAVVPML